MQLSRVRSGPLGLLLGAGLAAASLFAVYQVRSEFRIDLDVRSVVRGVYPSERAGAERFSWTSGEVTVDLPGLDRTVPWTCTLQVRGARPDPATLPQVLVSVDGAPGTSLTATNDFQPLTLDIPPRRGDGAHVRLVTSNTFQPGPTDTRALGMQIRDWSCVTAEGARASPPRHLLPGVMAAGGIACAAFGLLGAGAGGILAGGALIGAGQAVLLSQSVGAFTRYAQRLPVLMLWLALPLTAIGLLFEWRKRRLLAPATRSLILLSITAAYLKLAAMLHPAMPMGDALFHAHRLERVLSGDYYFTQPLAGGMEFPYSIALYFVAAPFTWLTDDHVFLLRAIVVIVETAAAALLCAMAISNWGDRIAGVTATALFTLVPVSFVVLNDGNLTNAFGRAVALGAVGVTAFAAMTERRWAVASLTLLAAAAMLSHVSLLALVAMTLLTTALLFWWCGDRKAVGAAPVIVLGTVAAGVLSVVLYYGHFGDVYMRVLQSRLTPPATASEPAPVIVSGSGEPEVPAAGWVSTVGLRVGDAAALTVGTIGWPILILALVGLWRSRVDGLDRLLLVCGGWGLTWAVFTALGIAAPVDTQNQRFAGEFVGRVVYTTSPAAALLGARGGAWAWRRGPILRGAAAVVVLAAGAIGARAWFNLLY